MTSATCDATFGVEEEFLLVDPDSGRPRMNNVDVVREAAREGLQLQLELDQCQVETASKVCNHTSELHENLTAMRTAAADAARRCGAQLIAVGVPLTGSRQLPVTDKPRYKQMESMFGILVREQGICGCHVHVGVPNRETAIEVGNHLRPWLPALLALSANSPIHRGADTGYASWRSILWTRWPSAGPPPFFASAQDYDHAVAVMRECGIILDDAMVYWDVRPSINFPTIEVRVSDVPATVMETVLLAALIRALVVTARWAIAAGRGAPVVSAELLRAAYWRSAHDGLTGRGIDLPSSRQVPSARLLESLLRHVRPALEEIGDYALVTESIRTIVEHGNGAVEQRRTLHERGSIGDVVAAVASRTVRR